MGSGKGEWEECIGEIEGCVLDRAQSVIVRPNEEARRIKKLAPSEPPRGTAALAN